jgi:hypothetical protein
VVDYTAEDFQLGQTFDFVRRGGEGVYFQLPRLLKPSGLAATDLGPGNQNLFLLVWSGITRSKRIIFPSQEHQGVHRVPESRMEAANSGR